MNLYEKLQAKEEKLSVIGLGYVGLPVAIEFAKKFDTVGFDVDQEKLDKYVSGHDVTEEVGDDMLQASTITFSSDEADVKTCKFHVVAVPTPINTDKDRKSTRLNSSHVAISYAVFCLKKKTRSKKTEQLLA